MQGIVPKPILKKRVVIPTPGAVDVQLPPIENQLHWILDVGFHEDQAHSTRGHSAENLAVIRHLAVSLLSQDKSAKGGTHAKRLKAGWHHRYLLQILSQTTSPPRKRQI